MCCVWCYWVCFPFSAQVCGAVLCGIPGKPAVHQMSSEGAFFKSYAMDVWCQSIASTSGNVFLYRLSRFILHLLSIQDLSPRLFSFPLACPTARSPALDSGDCVPWSERRSASPLPVALEGLRPCLYFSYIK